ncbi:hypothetical protein Ancab_004460, partial [Ancistrocladus abbreviatus]
MPTFHSLEKTYRSITPRGPHLIASPRLPDDLGMGMVLTSTPCAPISFTPVMMIDIALLEGIGLDFYQGPNQNLAAPTVGPHDEHSTTQLVDDGKNEAEGQTLFEQLICPPEKFGKIKLNSNDTMVKNLKQLKVDNSSSKGPSINSNDVKHRKREEDGKYNHKKRKIRKPLILQLCHDSVYRIPIP